MISREQLQADLTHTYDLLKRHHPNLTAHKSRDELDALYDSLLQQTKEQNTAAVAFLALTALVGAVCDEHTRLKKKPVNPSQFPGGWPWFEFPLFLSDGKLYLEDPRDGTKEQVISIGDHSGTDVAAAIITRQPSDGCLGERTLEINERLRFNSELIRSTIGKTGPYIVRSRKDNAPTTDVRILKEAAPAARHGRYRKFQIQRSRALEKQLLLSGFLREFLGPELVSAGLDYWFATQRNIAYLRIEQFYTFDKSAAGFDRVLRKVIQKKPDALIIDLVNNPGGWSKTSQLLVAYMTAKAHRLHSKTYMKNVSANHPSDFSYIDESRKKQFLTDAAYFRNIRPTNGSRTADVKRRSFGKPDYKGQIFILVGPSSRSNAIRVASTLKRLRNATIVGAATATNTVSYCADANGEYVLQHSGFVLRIPDRCFQAPESRFNEDGSLVPDIQVDPLNWPLAELNSMILKVALQDLELTKSN
ncbi:MAG: hypothetical protein GY807_07640 [Gammaproteobacteria bacterium]|nr:hypothetical protein [Gammaproteobacteria bacterium]